MQRGEGGGGGGGGVSTKTTGCLPLTCAVRSIFAAGAMDTVLFGALILCPPAWLWYVRAQTPYG